MKNHLLYRTLAAVAVIAILLTSILPGILG